MGLPPLLDRPLPHPGGRVDSVFLGSQGWPARGLRKRTRCSSAPTPPRIVLGSQAGVPGPPDGHLTASSRQSPSQSQGGGCLCATLVSCRLSQPVTSLTCSCHASLPFHTHFPVPTCPASHAPSSSPRCSPWKAVGDDPHWLGFGGARATSGLALRDV